MWTLVTKCYPAGITCVLLLLSINTESVHGVNGLCLDNRTKDQRRNPTIGFACLRQPVQDVRMSW